MNSSLRRIKIFLGLMPVILVTLYGCTIGNTKFVFGELIEQEIILDMGEYGKCDKQKAYVYLLVAKDEYEEIFGETVWEMEVEGLTMEEYVKNNTLAELLQRESMSALAVYRGIELSEKEIDDVSDKTEEFYQNTDKKVLDNLGITKQHIEAVFIAQALSELVFESISGTVNTQISDSEAKVITVQYVKFPKGTDVDYDAGALEDLDSFATNFVDAEVTEVDFCRGEVAKLFGEDAENIVFALENGAISSILTIDGYNYIFKSVNDYDEDKTRENKKVMLEERKRQTFLLEYDEFMQASEYVIDKELWDEISISDLEVVK